MVSKELVRELIGDYSADRFVRVLKMACAPASFMSVRKDYRFRDVSDEPIRVLGVVGNLPGENGLPAPLLVADVPLSTVLTERSSRIRQFKLAKKVLEHFAATPPMELDGVIAQGVFVFHDADGRFRVSLVTATPENGRFNWSKARRQSFYVTNDPDANATFVQRMCMNWGTLKGIKEAFSVEKLTKEFYNQLFAWYERVCDDERVEYPNGLDTDADNREDKNRKHIIRLITRLMFVWFLKQKKLVPDSLFDEAELKRILKDFNPVGRKQHQYYRAILQNLFFATLNSEVEERGFAESPNPRPSDGKVMSRHHGVKTKYRYADEFAISRQKILDLFRPIPFLNGGLFECLDQENADGKVMYYDGFSPQERHRDLGTLTWAHVPNDLFFDPDYGIIPLLRRYNFTVEENSPGDEDVALDPELLGKVFENLLGAFNPETAKDARNMTGSFYTPREIVNYMVDESLIAHLTSAVGGRGATALPGNGRARTPAAPNSDELTIRALVVDGVRPSDEALCKWLVEAIETAKILDPACGSGAFPMGALLKMVELLRILKKLPEDANLYDLKLKLIENCIFGSDIQEIAVQISKLRIFISLVCEQKPDRTKPNYGINTLPNLETKFVAANSLIALKKEEKGKKVQGDLFYDLDEIRQTKKELWDVRHRHFTAQTRREKNELRQKDKVLRGKLAATAKRFGYSEESTRLMASWDPYNQNVHAEFFDPEWMFNVNEGFDIVIGNPPYGAELSDSDKAICKKTYKSAKTIPGVQKGSMDTYSLFIEKGFNLLTIGGVLNYIVPISFTSSDSITGVHRLLFDNCETIQVSSYAVRPEPVFANATVNTSIIKFVRTGTRCKQILATKMYRKGKGFNLSSLISNLDFADVTDYLLKGRIPKIGLPIEISILKKVRSQIPIAHYVSNDGEPLFYRTSGGRYFKVVTNYSTGSTKEPQTPFRVDKMVRDTIGCALSSNLAFWFYQIYSNNLDWKRYEIESFTIPKHFEKRIREIEAIYSEYLNDIERNANIRTSSGKSRYKVETFKEYKIGKSKKIIDRIDDLIGPLYGLTPEEIDFVKSYEIEFRISESADDEIRVVEGKDKEGEGGNVNGRDARCPSGVTKKRKPKIEEEF